MPNTTNENVNPYEKYFIIETSGEKMGQVSLNNAYRGEGVGGYPASIRDTEKDAQQQPLPEMLVIPDSIDGTPVTSLAQGMFAGNNCVKRITLPTTVTTIPEFFCRLATNLRSIHGTENIETIEKAAFRSTRIKNALFPKLTSLYDGAFSGCAYLTVVDIGQVNIIPQQAFANCALLCEVIARNKVTSIGNMAFYQTRSLRELPLLADVTAVSEYAFLYSSIRTSLPAGNGIVETAFPANKLTTKFWSDVPFTPCRNRVATKFSHQNTDWANANLPDKDANRRALFAVMHIHSAITGKYYTHPDEFTNELGAQNISRCFEDGWSGAIENVEDLFIALGHRTEVRGKDKSLDSKDYTALVDALAHGGYVYTQIHTLDDKGGLHGVAIYGIDELGDVCVLDSLTMHEPFRSAGLEPGVDIYTYTTPYQNLVYSMLDFIIVYPADKEPTVEWTGSGNTYAFTLNSKPSVYPKNRVTISPVIDDDKTFYSESGILTAYRVGDYAFRTFMSDTDGALRLQFQSETEDKWLDWIACNQKDFTRVPDNQVLETTPPSDISDGVSVCAVSKTDSGLPDGGIGYVTTYRLHSPSTESTGNVDIIKEEWHPMMNHKKYVRYAIISENNWGPWYVFTPGDYNPQTEGTSGEGQ